MSLVDKITKAMGQGLDTGRAHGPGSSRAELTIIPGSVGQDMPKPKPLEEIGVSGLLRTRGVGYVYDEFLRDLNTYRQKQVYREMRDNDAVIGAMFFALEMILRRAEWRVEPADTKLGEKRSEFVNECMEDMSHTWEDFIAECVNMFVFGFALFETVYKRRQGPAGKKASKYDDGLIGWRKHAPRSQESILYWIWDDEGGLQGAVQLAAPDYKTVPIPIEKLLLFRTTSQKNNPEGRSILRNCYRSWVFKRRIEEVEAIGIERDLCGIPVLYCSADALEAMGGEQKARQLVKNIRIDDQMGIVLPIAYDDKGKELVKLELLHGAGSKQMKPSETIARYNHDLLNTILAGFIEMGQHPTGSRSLHMSATQIFAVAISAFMDSIAAIMNRIAIPRLFALNKFDHMDAPKLVPGEIGYRDLAELSAYISQLSQAGLTFFDKPTADYLRTAARLPEVPDEAMPGTGAQPPPGQAPSAGVQAPPGVTGSAGRVHFAIPGTDAPKGTNPIPPAAMQGMPAQTQQVPGQIPPQEGK